MATCDPSIFITFIGAAAGGIVAAICSFIFSKKLFDRQRLIEASAKFREIFTEEISIVISNPEEDKKRILSNRDKYFIEQEREYVTFRPFIKNIKLNDFDAAWKDYKKQYKHMNACAVPKAGAIEDGFTLSSEKERREIIHNCIKKLFEYAPTK